MATSEGFSVVRGDTVTGDTATGKPEDLEDARNIVRDPADANSDEQPPVSGSKLGGIMIRMQAQQQEGNLSEEAQANLETVRDTISEDPAATQALDYMLAQGRLSGDDEAVLDELAQLSTDPLAEGLERGPLVADAVQEIADPTVISQEAYGTCVPTTASIHLARNNPAEYVRLVRGLASPEGEVTLANGDRIRREDGTIDEPEGYEHGERTQSHRLLVPALMEYGNGTRDYDPIDDSQQRDYGFFHRFDGRGLDSGGMNRIMEGITGEEWDTDRISADEAEAAVEEIAERTSRGEDVPVALRWGDGGHAVLVTQVDDDSVHYVNPWGQEETIPRDVFEANLTSRHILEA